MRAFWLSLFTLIVCLSFAQTVIPEGQMLLPQDENILSGVLENGIKYYIVENSQPANLAELRLYVDVGSIVEDDDQVGLAHFTEHMAFNGTKHFDRTEVVDYLTSIGMGFANGLNAMTSYDFTMYQLKIPTDNKEQLDKGFLILSDMAHNVSFLPDELESERGVIIEEWRMGQNAQSRISDKVSKVRFAGSRYADRAPIGTYEILTTFTRDEIVRFYEDWYRPDLQSVVVVGDLPQEEALALVEKHFAHIPPHENPRPRETYRVPDFPEARAVVATDPEYPYSTITASWTREDKSLKTYEDFYLQLHETLFFDMLNARLGELSQSENPPFSMAYGYSGSMLKGLNSTDLMAYAATGKNREALSTLLTEAERVRLHGFTMSELDRSKTRVIRQLERAVEQSSTRESSAITWQIFSGLSGDDAIMSPQQSLDLGLLMMGMVNLDYINRLVDELITEENLTITYTANEGVDITHPTEEQLLAVYSEVLDTEIEPYEDKEVVQDLMEEKPEPGKIVKRKTRKKSGIEEWTLSNGAKVYLKKTDFKKDEILFRAQSPGGYTRYDADKTYTARLLEDYLSSSGVGEFDSTELGRIRTGKIANVLPYVSRNFEGMSGQASPKDLEFMFELAHEYATNARFDQKSLNSFINRNRPFYENLASNPERAFFNSLNEHSECHHPMSGSIDVDKLDALTLEDLQDIYNDRFADFSDFRFFFVGNFDEELMEEYVETYLASLPKVRRKDKIVDAKIRKFKGKHEVRFSKGASESAQVAHMTNGRIRQNDKNRSRIDAMLTVLNEKLRENIREELGGVYVVQAWQSYSQHPKEEYEITIYMACSPENVDELNEALFETIECVRKGDFDQSYVDSAKLVLKKRYEENISQNRYWQANIINNVLDRKKIDGFLNMQKRYDKINKRTVVRAAKKYLNFGKNKLTVIMVPEKSAITEE